MEQEQNRAPHSIKDVDEHLHQLWTILITAAFLFWIGAPVLAIYLLLFTHIFEGVNNIMAEKLTKELLQGMEFTEEIDIELQGQQFKLEVRPLNGPEAEKVEAAMQAGTDMKGRSGKGGKMEQSITMDMQKNTKGRKDSDIKAAAFGTVDGEFTEDVIKTMWPNNLIRQVADKVKEMSGIGNQADVERFRTRNDDSGDGSGDDDQPEGDSGDTKE